MAKGKIHISPKTGRPGLCSTENCPFDVEGGEPAVHYDTREEAIAAIEEAEKRRAEAEKRIDGTLKKPSQKKLMEDLQNDVEDARENLARYGTVSSLRQASAPYQINQIFDSKQMRTIYDRFPENKKLREHLESSSSWRYTDAELSDPKVIQKIVASPEKFYRNATRMLLSGDLSKEDTNAIVNKIVSTPQSMPQNIAKTLDKDSKLTKEQKIRIVENIPEMYLTDMQVRDSNWGEDGADYVKAMNLYNAGTVARNTKDPKVMKAAYDRTLNEDMSHGKLHEIRDGIINNPYIPDDLLKEVAKREPRAATALRVKKLREAGAFDNLKTTSEEKRYYGGNEVSIKFVPEEVEKAGLRPEDVHFAFGKGLLATSYDPKTGVLKGFTN